MERANAFNDQIVATEKEAIDAATIIKKTHKVTVTDIDMPFTSMVRFMVKWAIATIPAIIILYILAAMLGGFVTGLLK